MWVSPGPSAYEQANRALHRNFHDPKDVPHDQKATGLIFRLIYNAEADEAQASRVS